MSKPVTGRIQKMCDEVKKTVLDFIDKTSVDMYDGISYIEENDDPASMFYVKIQVYAEETGYIHVKIKVPSKDSEPECVDTLDNQTKDAPITSF